MPATKSSEEFQGKNDNKLSAWGGWAAVWTLFALAVLAKGPIAMLLPAAVIGLFLMIVNHRASEQQRPSRAATWTAWIGEWLRFVGPTNFLRSLWQMRPISGTLIVLAVAGTWFVLVGWRTDGAWPSEFFLKNNLLRFAEPAQGHGGGPWYYIVALLVGFFPWAVFLGPTAARVARRARRDDPDHPIYLLLLCWIGIWFVFWSLCSTKLPHYILPMYPAVALLTGDFLASWRRADERCVAWWVHSSGATMVVVGLGAAVALPIVTHMFVPDETWLTAIALVPILGGAAWWRLAATGRRGPALAAFATTAVLLLVAVFAVGAARVGRYRNAPWLARTIADQGATHDDVAAYRFFRHSWAYYLGGPIPELRDQKQIDAFLHATDGGYVVTRQDDAERLLDEFPDRLIEVSRPRRFLESEDLVLLGSRPRFTAERVRHRIEQR